MLTYSDQNIIFEKNHISVNIPLSYIGQYIIFNIDRYMLTYSDDLLKYIHRRIAYDETQGISKDSDNKESFRFTNWLNGNLT